MRNNIIIIFFLFTFFCNAFANDQFTFDVSKIEISENGNKIIGTNRGLITSNSGIIIEADEFEYNKKKIMIIKIIVTLKNGVLDPQGKAIQQTLNGMNFSSVNDVRQGKFFEINVNENDETKAKLQVEDMCKKLLANLVIEDYKIL